MLSTAISVQFIVNDLNATYEIIGTSDNYSFSHNFGRGDTLVDFKGAVANKVVSLEGNYGIFEVKLFAVNQVGIRSAFIKETVSVKPPRFSGSFLFSEIKINDLPEDSKIGAKVKQYPSIENGKLIVDSEYVGRDIEFAWKLTAPAGHVLEGQSLDYDLINDSFLSGFNIELYNDGQKVDFSNLDPTSDAAVNLAADLNTEPGNIDDILLNYKQFDFNISQETFDSLNLSRNLSLNVVAVDYFGNTSTGLINAKNYSPTVFNFTNSLSSSRMSFSWSEGDTDYSGIKINYLSIPSDQELYNSLDLEDSRSYYQKISQAKNYDSINGASYTNGEMVLYSDGLVYECINSHTRQGSASAPGNTANWKLIGDTIDYQSEEIEINGFSFGIDQKWGHSYYYQLQPHDNYGAGETFNLTETSLVTKGNVGSDLKPFFLEIKLSNIEFREQEDDFFFDWEVLDQDNNAVDIDKYRFPLSNADLPSILGISGSLFDADTNVFLSGITEGYNSRSVTVDQNGNEVINESLPTAKNFSSFLYTRELNNAIYGTGGWISDYEQYDNTVQYNIGDVVLADNNLLYESLIGGLNFAPVYDEWQKSRNYVVGDVFQYQNNVVKCIADFGPETISSYNESNTYSVGDIVIAPNSAIRVFNSSENYSIGTEVLYQGGLYTAVRSMTSSSPVTPGTDLNYWSRISFFSSIESAYFKLTNDSNPQVPFLSRNHWQIVDPKKLSDQGLYFEVIVDSYIYDISNWSSQNQYNKGDFVVYSNDIWSGVSSSLNEIPSVGSQVWTNTSNGEDIGTGYQQGDLVFSNGIVYQCSQGSPVAGPIEAFTDSYESINSSYEQSNWIPVWENKNEYDNFVFKHVGIPESGKRSVGIEIGIIDTDGNIIDKKRKIAVNPAPAITDDGFSKQKYKEIESTEETTKVKFRFNYTDEGKREKTTKVNLYRSEVADFSILNSDGLPFESSDEPGSTLVKTVVGAADASLGTNINEIIDTPPVHVDQYGIESRKGWFYKILPFDDFGSGYLYEYDEKILVWPRNYSDQTENGIAGPVISLTEDAIPQGVLNFNGNTAFTTYFLHWNIPNSQVLENDIISIPPNDLSHYEVWLSNDSQVLQKSNQDFEKSINADGYRRVIGDVKSSIGASENIPPDAFDPGLSITNAKNIFNVPASSPSVETSYIGDQGDTGYFWIRAVDKAGNKSPFVGAEDPDSDYVDGLKLVLAGVETTDLVDFQKNLTEEFKNTIALDPPNPFDHNAGTLSWAEHDLWLNGNKYDISAGSLAYVNSGYVWWDFGSAEYSGSNTHPGGSDGFDALESFNDGDFIVAKNSAAGETLAYEVFANALIGTAQISELAVTDAKIQTLTADKITAGQIRGHRIEVFHSGEEGEDPNLVEKSKYGSVASAGFSGLIFDQNNPSQLADENGFVLSGDGTFAFQAGESSLAFENNQLTLRGSLRQRNGKDYDFIDVNAIPSYFNYIETDLGFQLQDDSSVNIEAVFRNTSIDNIDDVLFKMKTVVNGQSYDVFGYGDLTQGNNRTISGFNYYSFGPAEDGSYIARAVLPGGFLETEDGFHDIVTNPVNGATGDAVIVYVSGVNSIHERTVTISRVTDGKIGRSAQIVKLESSDYSIRFSNEGETSSPSIQNFTLSASAFNFEGQLTYLFEEDGVEISKQPGDDENTRLITVDTLSSYPKNYRVTVSNQDGATATDSITVIAIQDGNIGSDGRTPTYRGNWLRNLSQLNIGDTIKYEQTNTRGDIVEFYTPTDNYWICTEPHWIKKNTSDSYSLSFDGLNFGSAYLLTNAYWQAGSSYWNDNWQNFGTELDNVATSLLLTNEAYITDRLIIGDQQDDGLILSNGFKGAFHGYFNPWNQDDSYSPGSVVYRNGIVYVQNLQVSISGAIYDPDLSPTYNGANVWRLFETEQDQDYSSAGFLLGKGSDENAYFDIGGISRDEQGNLIIEDGGADVVSYMRFNSTRGKLEIRGASVNNTSENQIEAILNSSGDGLEYNNVRDTLATFVGGGYVNTITDPNNSNSYRSLASSIIGGAYNSIEGRFSLIGNGYLNDCKDNFSAIVAGYNNSMPQGGPNNQGSNFIGAGQNNVINGGTNQAILAGQNNQIIYTL